MVGCYGNKQAKTPNLDRKASEGVHFNHCISPNPVCRPYSGILLSGQHPLCNETMINDIQMLPGSGKHFAEVLCDSGYHTGYIGKWHLYGGVHPPCLAD
jgi:arylsulfatase A-like enzyme